MKPTNPTPSNTGSTRSFQRDTEREKHKALEGGLAESILRVILAHKTFAGGLAESILRVILAHKTFEGGLAESILRVILRHKTFEGLLAESIFRPNVMDSAFPIISFVVIIWIIRNVIVSWICSWQVKLL